MAKNQDKKDKDEKSLVDNLDQFRGASKLITSSLYGTDEQFSDDNSNDLTNIESVVKKVNSKYTSNVNDNFMEFYNATTIENDTKSNKKVKNDTKKYLMNINKMIEDNSNNSSNSINELLVQEADRIALYNSFQLIYDNIPQLAQAVNTYVDNILSPDDFTKNIFNIFIDNELSTTIQSSGNKDRLDVINNCNQLIKDYKLETISERIIHDSLVLGDQFVTVLPLDRELEKLTLNESIMPHYNKERIKPENIIINEDEMIQLKELFNPNSNTNIKVNSNNKDKKLLNESNNVKIDFDEKLLEDERIKEQIAELINENFIIADDSRCLLENNLNSINEFMGGKNNKLNKVDLFNSYQSMINKNSPKKKTDDPIHVQGSVMKILEPDRVVKLSLDDVVYGYFYIENLENAGDVLTRGPYGITNNVFSNYAAFQNSQPDLINAKYKLITDIFVKNIAHKIDKKFINNHPTFKNTIYNLLKQNFIINRQVRMVYLRPDEVIHFGKGIKEYHESILAPIMFSAKLYLTVLTSQVMLRLVRSPEKRVYYIETDLDNSSEETVQTFIRDVKTKEFTVSNFNQDINTLLRSVGTFDDYYIPVKLTAALYRNI